MKDNKGLDGSLYQYYSFNLEAQLNPGSVFFSFKGRFLRGAISYAQSQKHTAGCQSKVQTKYGGLDIISLIPLV